MSQKEAQGLLQIASDNVEFGIYAVDPVNNLSFLISIVKDIQTAVLSLVFV